MDSTRRSWTKAILWNLIGFASMSVVGLIMTGSLSVGGGMALINTAMGFSLYLLYERLWARVRWGRL
ncbi:MAG: DUF2061 domain-containing protein [Rhodobacteraceae bacterium]|nr:DUF2061 domain-containing protein [Paracoccaceae bacterium]